jgi:hypothetical protein
VQFTPPSSLVEGVMEEKENPFVKLLQSRQDRQFPLYRYDLDLQDDTPFDRQIFDQVGCTAAGSGVTAGICVYASSVCWLVCTIFSMFMTFIRPLPMDACLLPSALLQWLT